MACVEAVQLLVQGPEDLNFFFYVDRINYGLSVEANTHRNSNRRTSTSSTTMNPDTINVSGIISCLTCGGTDQDLEDIVPRLKRTQAVATYSTDQLLTITTPHAYAVNCILRRVTVTANGNEPQLLRVDMEYEGEDLHGIIGGPEYTLGGIQP